MNTDDYRAEIKCIFDEFYEGLKKYSKFDIQVLKEDDIPKEMFTGEIEIDKDFYKEYNKIIELKTWKYMPSTVSSEDIAELEKTLAIKLPVPLLAYYTSYFHFFGADLGISENSPNLKMNGIYMAYNSFMISHGYLPFSWIQDGWLICMKIDENGNDSGIYTIDHECMFDFEYRNANVSEIESEMNFDSADFLSYLRKYTLGYIDFLKNN